MKTRYRLMIGAAAALGLDCGFTAFSVAIGSAIVNVPDEDIQS